MIKIRELTKRYPQETRDALSRVSLDLPRSGVVVVRGRSGAGKTTLCSILAGMVGDFEGRVLFDDLELGAMSEKERADFRADKVSMAFQEGFLAEEAKVIDEVERPLQLLGEKRGEMRERVMALLSRLGMGELADRTVKQLSGGERKRVALAKALAKEAPLTVLDEPTAGLNTRLTQIVESLIREMGAGRLILVITHDDSFLADLDTILMDDGKAEYIAKSRRDYKCDTPILKEARQISLLALIREAIRYFFSSVKHSFISIMAMGFAMIVAGFSLLMVDGVGRGMKNLVGTSLDELSAVVTPRYNQNSENRSGLYLSSDQLRRLSGLSDSFAGIGTRYIGGLNSFFTPESGVRVSLNGKRLYKNFGIDSLINAELLLEETWDIFPDIEVGSIEIDRVVISVNDAFYRLLVQESGGESNLERAVRSSGLKIAVVAGISSVSGDKRFSLPVAALIRSDGFGIFHPDPEFPSYVVEGLLSLETSYDLHALDPTPLTLKGAGVFWVARERMSDFFRAFQVSSQCSSLALEKVFSNEQTQALGVSYRQGEQVSPQDCLSMYFRAGEDIVGYSLSSPAYTYISGGMYEGFLAPIFLSSDRSKLNDMMDRNSLTDWNLAAYTFSDDEMPEGVFASSLTDSILGRGVNVRSPADRVLVGGKIAADDGSVGITVGLAEALFPAANMAVGKILNLLMLKETREVSGGFANSFAEISLRISGIFEGEDKALIHDAFFPLALAFNCSDYFTPSLGCDAFVLRFASPEAMEIGLKELMSEFPQYRFTAPVKETIEAIEEVLQSIGRGLGAFGGIAIVLALVLFILSSTLTVQRARRRLGDLLAMGCQRRHIFVFIAFQTLMAGTIAWGEAILALLVADRLVARKLLEIFQGGYTSSAISTILVVGTIGFACVLIAGIASFARLRTLDPLAALRDKNLKPLSRA